tara:strand:- start:3620 stop:4225 length:606 start_codon:yes stop_codon:yes gene_type:complete
MINEAYHGDYIIKENDSFEDDNSWGVSTLRNRFKIPSIKVTEIERDLFDVYTKNIRHYQTDKIHLRVLTKTSESVSIQAAHTHILTKHELIKTLLSFKSLVNNWDGYGAVPLELDSATNAITIISLVDDFIISKINDIYPNPNGTVSIIWKNQNNDIISLEIGNNYMSYFVKSSGEEPRFFDNIQIDSSSVKKLSSFVRVL